MTVQQEAIRLECNLCHSIPVVAGAYDFVADIEISRGPEPQSHLNTNWIGLHRNVFDQTCQNCHSIADAGGTSNSSFCSNSACHGNVYEFAGFDAPALRAILLDQLAAVTPEPASAGQPAAQQAPTPTAQTPAEEPAATPQPTAPEEQPLPPAPAVPAGELTFAGAIGALLQARCGACHGQNAMLGLDLTSYAAALAGSENGSVILPGDALNSSLVLKQTGQMPHFGQFTPQELALIEAWIAAGAPEK
jgi:mono/diheme cytochrome c family protein